jgi:hypothetical protein
MNAFLIAVKQKDKIKEEKEIKGSIGIAVRFGILNNVWCRERWF